MFSISELSFASCKPSVLIRMPWFGMDAAMPFSSARRRLALASFFRIAGVSKRASVQLLKRRMMSMASDSSQVYDVYRKCNFLNMLTLTCIENAFFYTCQL